MVTAHYEGKAVYQAQQFSQEEQRLQVPFLADRAAGVNPQTA